MLTVEVCVDGAALSLFICLQKKIVFTSIRCLLFFLCDCTAIVQTKHLPKGRQIKIWLQQQIKKSENHEKVSNEEENTKKREKRSEKEKKKRKENKAEH